MPRLAVVFDSNLYRGQSPAVFAELAPLEANRSVIAFASYFVVTEFLARIADAADPAHSAAWAALRRLWRHCKHYDGARELLRLVGDSEGQVPYTLFKTTVAGRDEEAESYGYTVGRLVAEGTAALSTFQELLSSLQDHVQRSESEFVATLFDQVVRTLNPSATSWTDVKRSPMRTSILARLQKGDGQQLVARAIASKAANAIGRTLTDAALADYSQRVLEMFPTPVAFYDRLVTRVIRDGIDMSLYPRPNSLWDYQITFSTGNGARLMGCPVWLVTNDGEILDAAEAAGTANIIRNFNEYRRVLRLPMDEFDAVIEGRTP